MNPPEISSLPSKDRPETEDKLHPLVLATRQKDIWNALLALRTVNALLLCTFFQPDEFYQTQEPAWQLAFGTGRSPWLDGAGDGAWLTWVCLFHFCAMILVLGNYT